ncbi:MAG: NAD(P)/FAD-dependent oxidoreductase [Patescibacteria group bacterium]|nr:NAD(P)/FAD-dependent oxidoreductase [Patescibacteria group bacterium]
MKFNIVIVGAGPAGMFSAYELIKKCPKLKILVIDKGKEVKKRICPMNETGKCCHCVPCHNMCGMGGAGTFSDGLLNLRPDIGGDLTEFTKNENRAWKLMDVVDKVFLRFGAPRKLFGILTPEIEALEQRAASVGIKFIRIKQRHIGSDNTPKIIQKFSQFLKKKNVKFLMEKEVTDLIVEGNKCRGVVLKSEQKIGSDFTLIAPGRVGISWVTKMIAKHKMKAEYLPIDVGVRVEVPAIIMGPVIEASRDPKFHIWTTRYGDFVRTFCTNHQGFVVKEHYDGFIGVNGHSLINKKSENTNFAFLVKVTLTEPFENTTLYGQSIAQMATLLGEGKPIIQRLGDMRRGRRSTFERLKRSIISPTLKDVTPGNIAMALPHRILTDIIEGLEKLNAVIPGVACDSTFLYAPEIKFYSMRINVKENMETDIRNLFAAGDGVGLSRGIVSAAATGVLAAQGILKS